MKSTKINITYEDIRETLIYDMRRRFEGTRELYDAFTYYMNYNGAGMVAANMVQHIFESICPFNFAIFEHFDVLPYVMRKEDAIATVTKNIKSMFGIVKMARHMHLIKNTINFTIHEKAD